MSGLIPVYLSKVQEMNNSTTPSPTIADIHHENTFKRKLSSTWMKIKSFFHGNPPAIIGTFLLILILLGALFAPVLSSHNPDKRVARPHLAPSSEHFFGTTRSGRDVYSQVLQGARKTLSVALFCRRYCHYNSCFCWYYFWLFWRENR